MKAKWIFISLIMILVLFYGLSRYFFVPTSTEQGPGDLDEIKSRGEIHIAVEMSDDGCAVTDSGVKTGLQYSLADRFAQRIGVKPVFIVEDNLGKCIEMLDNHECDLIARLIPVTKTLRDTLSFTESLVKDRQVLVQRVKKDTASVFITNQLDLRGKHISLPEMSPAITRVENLSHELGDTIYIDVIKKYDHEQIVVMVAGGDVDYTICDMQTAKRLAAQFDNLDIHLQVGFSQLHAWGIRKDCPALLDSLNVFIKEEASEFVPAVDNQKKRKRNKSR